MFEILSKPEKMNIKAGEAPPIEPPDNCSCSTEACAEKCGPNVGTSHAGMNSAHTSTSKSQT